MRRDAKDRLATTKNGPGRRGLIYMTLTALLVVIFAASCAKTQQPERPAVDLETAKSTTMANEREMAAVIPPEDTVGMGQK